MSKKPTYIPQLKNTLLPKNAKHYLSFQQVIIFLLVEVLDLILIAAD